jgi:tRNA(Ile)-lysidine synthase
MDQALREIARASEVSHALSPDLLPAGSAVLVACSGGADSTALAAAAAARAQDLSLHVVLGHVDHALRADSQEDAERVARLAAALGLPFRGARLASLTREIRALGLEAAAREARYDVLEKLAREAACDRIATAHTRRDQAETILLRLARGAGPGALAGIRRDRTLASGVRLVRPLLGVPREATEDLCERLGLSFSRDPHNSDPERARARLRAVWPALLEALGPRLEQALAGSARIAADEDALLQTLAVEALREAEVPGGLDAQALARLPPALARRCLLAASAGVLRPERAHLEQMVGLLERPRAALDVPGGRFHVVSGVLRIEQRAGSGKPESCAPFRAGAK